MAEKNSLVNVHSKLTVVSSRPIGQGKTHQLSPLDHSMGRHSIHIVFYYRTNPFPDSSDLASLRVSLSELLCSYPPVTGRLMAQQPAEESHGGGGGGGDNYWVVKCNDAGVRMLWAKVGATLDEWLGFGSGSDERDLTVWEDMPDDPTIWSPFCIQISDFEGGGLAIGLSCSHMHADQTSATLLVKSWAELQRGEPISQPPVFHQLPTPDSKPPPKTSTMVSKFYANKPKDRVPKRKMATATFRFSDAKMKQCLSEIHIECPDATPFDALLALFWARVVKLNPSVEQNHTHYLTICRDSRKLIHPPLPIGYFGNALRFSRLSLDTEALQSWGLERVAGIVHNHVVSVEEEELCSVMDCFEREKGEELERYEQPFMMYGPELTCVSLEHMIIPGVPKGSSTTCESWMYEAMFRKDEKPVHVSYHVGNVEGEGLITVMPSPEGGLGRTVAVTLPEDQIAKLCEDQAVLDLDPTMLMNGKRR